MSDLNPGTLSAFESDRVINEVLVPMGLFVPTTECFSCKEKLVCVKLDGKNICTRCVDLEEYRRRKGT